MGGSNFCCAKNRFLPSKKQSLQPRLRCLSAITTPSSIRSPCAASELILGQIFDRLGQRVHLLTPTYVLFPEIARTCTETRLPPERDFSFDLAGLDVPDGTTLVSLVNPNNLSGGTFSLQTGFQQQYEFFQLSGTEPKGMRTAPSIIGMLQRFLHFFSCQPDRSRQLPPEGTAGSGMLGRQPTMVQIGDRGKIRSSFECCWRPISGHRQSSTIASSLAILFWKNTLYSKTNSRTHYVHFAHTFWYTFEGCRRKRCSESSMFSGR